MATLSKGDEGGGGGGRSNNIGRDEERKEGGVDMWGKGE